MSLIDDFRNTVANAMELGNERATSTADDTSTPADDGFAYGPPGTVVRESNFISDDDLLLWLAQRENGLYGELRDHMDMSRARSKLVEDLSHLKQQVDNKSLTPEEALAEIDRLLQAYQGTPFEQELTELLGPLRADISAGMVDPVMNLGEREVSHLSDALQTKIDALGRDDQLELIQIQSLTADIREAGQLASNLLANATQTSSTILGNIRG